MSEQDFEWTPEITYVGMTNSKAGLKQFDSTIIGKTGHGRGLTDLGINMKIIKTLRINFSFQFGYDKGT